MSALEDSKHPFPNRTEEVVFEIEIIVRERPKDSQLTGSGVTVVTQPKLYGNDCFFEDRAAAFQNEVVRMFETAPLGRYVMTARPHAIDFVELPQLESYEFNRLHTGLGTLAFPFVCDLVRAVEKFPSEDNVGRFAEEIFCALLRRGLDSASDEEGEVNLPDFTSIEVGCTSYMLGLIDVCSQQGQPITEGIVGVVATLLDGKVMLALYEYQHPFCDFFTEELARRVQKVLREEHPRMVVDYLAGNLFARRRGRACTQAVIAKYGIDGKAVRETVRALEEEEVSVRRRTGRDGLADGGIKSILGGIKGSISL
jgi:hypothetical protein